MATESGFVATSLVVDSILVRLSGLTLSEVRQVLSYLVGVPGNWDKYLETRGLLEKTG